MIDIDKKYVLPNVPNTFLLQLIQLNYLKPSVTEYNYL